MNKKRCLLALLFIALFTVSANSRPDQFTPLVAAALTADTQPVLGTDGRLHLVYELVLTNANATPATVQKIEVLDTENPSNALASYAGQELLTRLRTTGSTAVENPTIEFNGTRLLLIDFTLDSAGRAPKQLTHHITILGAPSPGHKPTTPVLLDYNAAPIQIHATKLPVIGAPLSGKGWLVLNGCCEVGGAHRSTSLPINGKLYFAQRFAIDWMLLDSAGRLVHGDASEVANYPGYGADVLAVADGTVVDTLNTLTDQKAGTMPDPKTITVENVDGNHIVLDLGDGVFAFYAHMQKGSIAVTPGARVKRGQVLGKLGNTGNTSGPHLHFHLMDGPSVLGSNGIPYVIDSFDLIGQVPAAEFAAATGVEGDWAKGMLPASSPRLDQFPLDLNIVNFASRK
jgi:hypothetical protein